MTVEKKNNAENGGAVIEYLILAVLVALTLLFVYGAFKEEIKAFWSKDAKPAECQVATPSPQNAVTEVKKELPAAVPAQTPAPVPTAATVQ